MLNIDEDSIFHLGIIVIGAIEMEMDENKVHGSHFSSFIGNHLLK